MGFSMCAQMLMHAIAHGSCANTVRESALKADPGRKFSRRTGESNLRQYGAWPFGPTLHQLSHIPAPHPTLSSKIQFKSQGYFIISVRESKHVANGTYFTENEHH